MRKIRPRIKGFCWGDVAIVSTIIIVIVLLAAEIISIIINASHKIDEGVIIDKNYRAPYVTYTNSSVGDTNIMIPVNHPESYSFTIQGEKNGETAAYTFNVTEDEYSKYKIGDYYKR